MLIAILTGVRSGRRASLMSGTGSLRPRFKQQVAMDDKADPRARSYRDRGLAVEIARRDLVAGSRTAGLRGKPDRAHEIDVAGQRWGERTVGDEGDWEGIDGGAAIY